MENIVAVARLLNTATKRYKFIYAWIKKEAEAFESCLKKTELGEEIVDVWTTEWKKEPSQYRLRYARGNTDASDVSSRPTFDMAAELRRQFIKPKGKDKGRKEKKIVQKHVVAIKKTAPAYQLFTVKEAV